MRRTWVAGLLIVPLAVLPACGDLKESGGSGDQGFSERDIRAARHFSRIQAQSPSLESLAVALRSERADRMRRVLRRLQRAVKRYQGVVREFEDPRARRAMGTFAAASAGVSSAYRKAVDYVASGRPSLTRASTLLRELDAAVVETNEADRRLHSVSSG